MYWNYTKDLYPFLLRGLTFTWSWNYIYTTYKLFLELFVKHFLEHFDTDWIKATENILRDTRDLSKTLFNTR